jgi:hypothetical protein
MELKSKKNLCVVFLLFLLPIERSIAQLSKEVSIGINAGTNTAYIIQPNSSSENLPAIGYQAGIVGSTSLSKYIILNASLSFSMNRSIQKLPQSFYDELIQKYQWLKMPISLNFIVNSSSKNRVFIGAGPALQTLISANAKYYNPDISHKISVYDQMNHLAIFVFGQAGLDFKRTAQKKISLSISYERSLSKLFSNTYQKDIDFAYKDDNSTLCALTLNVFYFL